MIQNVKYDTWAGNMLFEDSRNRKWGAQRTCRPCLANHSRSRGKGKSLTWQARFGCKLRPKPVWPYKNLAIQTSHQWSQSIFQGMVCSPLRMKRPGRNRYVSQCLFVSRLCSPWQQRNNRACCWCQRICMDFHGTPDWIWFIMFSNVFSMADTIEVPSWSAKCWAFVTATYLSTGSAVLRITHHRVETPGCRERKSTSWPVFSYLSCPTWSLLKVCKKTSHGHHT